MTEGTNRPQGTGDPVVPPGAQPGPIPPAPPERSGTGQQDPKDKAKQEASQVGQQASQRAGEVGDKAKATAKDTADQAKEKASETVGEARDRAQDLVAQGAQQLRSQVGEQQHRLAGGLRSVSEELNQMADGAQEQGLASDLARQASSYLDRAGQWLDDREPGDLLDEVSRYARRRPGMFIAVAAGAGLLAGRVARSLKDEGSDDDGGTSAAAGPSHRATATTPTPGTTQYQPAHGTPTTGAAAGPAGGPAGPASGYDTNLPGGGGAR